MTYDFAALARFLWRWVTLPGWSLKRLGVVLAFLVIYPVHEMLLWLGLALDRLLFAGFRRQRIDEPVFIVGNFRSGTTFIHRLLARDSARFTSMGLWEILIAPSITARRVLQALGRFERLIGRPVGRLVDWIENQWHDRVVVHKISFTEPEEDDYLGLHIWSVFVAGLSSGLLDEARPFAFFDRDLPPRRRKLILRFYHRCVQRHLYAHGGRQYLAKNPALSPKLDSVLAEFPDAKIIHMVRNPLETVPSFVSMMRWSWDVIDTPTDRRELVEFALQMAAHWYRYPLQRLAALPENSWIVVRYDDLVADPAATVRSIYDRFGFAIGDEYEQVLRAQAEAAGRYRSRHHYDLQALGLEPERILDEFADIFDRFGFDRELPDAAAV